MGLQRENVQLEKNWFQSKTKSKLLISTEIKKKKKKKALYCHNFFPRKYFEIKSRLKFFIQTVATVTTTVKGFSLHNTPLFSKLCL